MQAHRRRKVASRDLAPAASADCRRRGSWYLSAAFFGPAGGQRGGNERQEQLVVAGDGVAVRFGSAAAAAAAGSGGTLYYILQRTVVLDKVEVRGGDGAERDAEIANDGNGFQKNFGQKDGGAPIEIDAAGMHPLDQRAEEAEIVMRGVSQRRAVDGRMHVRNVRTDGEMDRHGNAVLVRSHEDAAIGVFDFDDTAREKLSGGFAIADANAVGKFGEFVDVLARFSSHPELAFAETGLDVFGGVAGEGDFEIVDEGGAVHGHPRNESALHEID